MDIEEEQSNYSDCSINEPTVNITYLGSPAQVSNRFETLQEEKEKDDDEELEEEEMDINQVYWCSEDETYVHVSGMRYDTKSKNYTTYVIDDLEDTRCLYYLPFYGILKLVRTGKRGT